MLQIRFILILTALIMNKLLLFDFSASEDWSGWDIENDVVMGGNSSAELKRSNEGNAIFKGNVSLENNGGFASLQYHYSTPKDIQGYKKVVLYLKGDGKTYQFRTKSNLEDKASYVYNFKTTGDWQTIEVPLDEMEPVYRGEKLNKPNFSANTLQEIRFFIGNNKEQDFWLEVDKIILK